MKFLSNSVKLPCLGVVHFVGIGGIGMSGIAEVMHNLGYTVQGSDLLENTNTKRLESLGIKIYIGHAKENVSLASYIVISSAVSSENIEIIHASQNNVPIIKRAEMLAELMRFKFSIAISGSHGKTTTTSLVASLFEFAGFRPTVINGGIINSKSTNAYLGDSEYLIAEADESDGTFIKVPSTIGVITNIDPEHMDYYKTFDNLIAAFKSFITNLPFYGFAVVCVDHPIVTSLIKNITERKIITYAIESDAHVKAFNIRSYIDKSIYDVVINLPHSQGHVVIENITLPAAGRHNILNSLAAVAIAAELDFGNKTIANGFKSFNGIKRRFTKIGEWNGVSIIDDYAHHPAEIAATTSTAREIVNKVGNGRVIAVLQPHRYSRVNNIFDDFTTCWRDVDILYISDIYSAGEEANGVTVESLILKISEVNPSLRVEYLKHSSDLARIIHDVARSGDVVIVMGAGTSTKWAAALPMELNNLK